MEAVEATEVFPQDVVDIKAIVVEQVVIKTNRTECNLCRRTKEAREELCNRDIDNQITGLLQRVNIVATVCHGLIGKAIACRRFSKSGRELKAQKPLTTDSCRS